ncbi:MAG: diaminopimelate dehydrogenase, partial [Alkalibacterium sp.]
GTVMRQGKTTDEHTSVYQFGLDLDSNPEFTAAVAIAYARAAGKLAHDKQYGAKTVFDIAPGYLSPKSSAQLRKELL